MAFWVTRESRAVVALALVSMGLGACSSATPTAPSPLSGSGAAPDAVTASVSSTSVTSGAAQLTTANTIKITQGTLALPSLAFGSVALRGSHGFRFDGDIISGLEPIACSPLGPCQPGATAPFRATWVGTDIPGAVRLQGDEFRVGGADTASVYIELTASFVAPAHLTDIASVTVPFAASGWLSPLGNPVVPLQLIGSGHVTFTLEWQSALNGWAITFSSFDFGGGPQ